MTKRNPPPMPFFTVSEQNECQETNARESQGNGFIIPARLPSLNEYINACRKNRYHGAKVKEAADARCMFAILQAVQSGELRKPTPPIRLAFVWHEKTRRRDADNVASAKSLYSTQCSASALSRTTAASTLRALPTRSLTTTAILSRYE